MATILQLLCLLLSTLSVCSSQDNLNCYYYYITQPSSSSTCNPWPLVNVEDNSTLTLHCNIMAPKNDELSNVRWFMARDDGEQEVRTMLYPGGSSRKYSNPVSSQDVSESLFKQVNFSLVIHDVNDSDLGCYLCEVHVTAGNSCWFDIRPSNQFCLLGENEYDGKDACDSIPSNDSFVCASNMTCDLDSTPVLSTITPPPIISSTEISSRLTTERGLSVLGSSLAAQVTTTGQPLVTSTAKISSPSETSTREKERSNSESSLATSVTSTIDSLSNSQVDSFVTTPASVSSQVTSSTKVRSTIQDSSRQRTTSVKSAIVSDHPNVQNSLPSFTTTTTASSQLQLRIGLYVGVGVCSLLLVVILLLLAAVAILCRKKAPGMKRLRQENEARRSMSISSPEPVESRIWTRTNSSQPTAIVNDNGAFHLLTDQSLPPSTNEFHTSNIDHPHTEIMSDRMTRDDSSKLRSDETELQHSASIPTALPKMKSKKRHSRESPNHHRLSLTNGFEDEHHMTGHTDQSKTKALPTSPETHYYHVLEEPRYYNFNWLARNAEGRELILQDRNRGGEKERSGERTISSPSNHGNKDIHQREDTQSEESSRPSSTQYDYADFRNVKVNGDHNISQLRPQVLDDHSSTERDQYHWTVLLSPNKKRASDTKPSAKKQKRQQYARLDCSTMEPKREYTQVNITHKEDEHDLY